DGRRRILGRQRRYHAAARGDQADTALYEVGRELRQVIVATLSPTVVEPDVAALNVAFRLQALIESRKEVSECARRAAVQKSDHRRCWLLRISGERPNSGATENRQESTSGHGDSCTGLTDPTSRAAPTVSHTERV